MQRTHQIIYKFKEQKKEVLPLQHLLPGSVDKQYRKSIAMATAGTKNLQKSIITTHVVSLARNIS